MYRAYHSDSRPLSQAYLLSDESADLTVEVSELISLSKDKLTKTFSLSDLE